MRNILILIIGCVLFSGCITNNYYCELYAAQKTRHLLTSSSRLVGGRPSIEARNSVSVTSRCSVGRSSAHYMPIITIGHLRFICLTKDSAYESQFPCNCGTDCHCSADATLKGDDKPVVSPEKINDSSEDANAPQMHKDKPWYIN